MTKNDHPGEDDGRYYAELAAAFVRGRSGESAALSSEELIAEGRARGLRLHKFKRQAELPRVRRVLGILQALCPQSLLDIGSGRGTFLWPLLDTFPLLNIIATDLSYRRVADIDAVRRGGFEHLRTVQMNAAALALADRSVDVVTALEVIEHLSAPALAAAEAIRVARHFVVASVPSKEDDNPEHIQLFTRDSFAVMWLRAGARSVRTEYVLNHMITVVRV